MSVQQLLFTSADGTTLFVTDGTTVTQLADGSSSPAFLSDPIYYDISAISAGSDTYITMADSTDQTSAIWQYNGTTLTQITSSSDYVFNTPDGNNATAPDPLTIYNGDVIFSQATLASNTAGDGNYDTATLAVFNPTTSAITQPTTPHGGYDPGDFVTLNGVLYFEATDSTTSSQAIYSYNGTSVTEIYNLHPTASYDSGAFTGVAAGAVAGPLVAFNGNLYFGSGQESVYELTSLTSLSNAATDVAGSAQYDYNPNAATDLIVANNHLFFLTINNGIYSLDTSNGLTNVLGSYGAQSFIPVVYNSAVYFIAYDIDPSISTTNLTANLYSSTGGAATLIKAGFNGAGNFAVMGSTLYYNDNSGTDLGTINDTTLGTLAVPGGVGGIPLVVTSAATSWSLAGGSSVSAPVITGITPDTGASSTDGITDTGALTVDGTAASGTTIDLYNGASQIGTTTTGSGGTWSITLGTALTAGNYTLTATATSGGTTSSVSAGYAVDVITTPPAVAESLVSDTGSSSTDRITSNDALTGGGDANVTVTLTEGSTTLGTTTANAAGTWTFTPSGLAQGSNTIVASETDLAGNTGTATLAFTLDTIPPVVTEALVSDTGSSSTDRITSDDALTGTADPNATVTLTEGSTTLGTTTANAAGTWTFTPSGLAQGANTIVASDTDIAGNTGTATLAFTFDTVAPAVTESLFDDTGSSSTDRITSNDELTGGGDPNATVTLTEGSTTLGTTTANAAGTWTFTPSGLAQGSNTIVASETDLAGNTGTATLAFTFDTIPPAVTEALVSDTGSSSTDGITSDDALTGTADPNATVTLTEGSTTLGTTTANAAGTWTFTPSGLAQGANTIVASDTDIAGNTGTATLAFTFDTVAPAVTESLFDDTGSSSTDRITSNDELTGGGDPNATVTLTEGSTTLGTTTANAAGTWTFTPSGLAQGSNTIVASETDLAGNTGTATLAFTFDTIPPAVTEALVSDTGSSSTDGITSDDEVTGSGDPNATVTLTEGATILGTTTANAAGTWFFTPASLAQGVNTIVASETDLAGNTGTASLTFTYDSAVPGPLQPVLVTASIGKLDATTNLGSAGDALVAKTPVATFTVATGLPNDVYSYALSGSSAGFFTIRSSGDTVTLSTGAKDLPGATGGKLYQVSLDTTDDTSGVTGATPLDIVVGNGWNDTIRLTSGANNMGLYPATTTFVYAEGRGATVDATGMTGSVFIAVGAELTTMTGGSGVNTYLFNLEQDSPVSAMSDITNFNPLKDMIDLTGLGLEPLTFQGNQLVGNNVAPDSIAWQQSGGNTYLYVNRAGFTETTGSTNLKIQLNGLLTLTASDILHH